MPEASRAEAVQVSGIVQGVGFRPTVFRLATERALRGSVCNDGDGVSIVVAGESERIDDFVRALSREAPPLARIDRIERAPHLEPVGAGFRIITSTSGRIRTEPSADAATCAACLAELHDPSNRRWRHPFINCTNCGPRLSIVRAMPYDRAGTSMAAFPMCAECEREYRDPRDRRFHAQPNACPACGPRLRLEPAAGGDSLQCAIELLRGGGIVAVKGIGGYHLACDAGSEPAVARLRERKRRPAKPFALMARDIAMIQRYCSVTDAERALLQSSAAPIVLLPADGPERLPPAVAPHQATLGFMLPYTALHHLLIARLARPIVLTSGNIAEEPQCTDDADALTRLGGLDRHGRPVRAESDTSGRTAQAHFAGIADAVLLHDRMVVNRLDDSVLRVVAGMPRLLRRGRGYAPASLPLPAGFEGAAPVLALGGELKNTICLLRDGGAILSQHIGDLGNARAASAFHATVALYETLFEHRPSVLAIDRHPDMRASRYGRDRAAADGLRLVEVQHHHAHIAACLAEHGVPLDAPPVLGIALDGLGWGDDGNLWGGEFLQAGYRGFIRLAGLRPVTMPGGEQAVHEPWRMAWAYLTQHAGLLPAHPRRGGAPGEAEALRPEIAALPFFEALRTRPVAVLQAMRRAGINSPTTSSCGRLFDAVAALIGVCEEARYDGQPAIELEACVDAEALASGTTYPFRTTDDSLDTAPLWPPLLADLARGVGPGVIAARFHLGLVEALVEMVERLTGRHRDPWEHRIALGGGVFQNAVMLDRLTARLQAAGYTVYSPSQVPANDGGLALGQAVVAAARTIGGPTKELQACASASRPR